MAASSEVRNLRLVSVGQTSIVIAWNPPSNNGGHKIDNYDVRIATNPQAVSASIRNFPASWNLSYVDIGQFFLQNTTYYIWVRAQNYDGASTWSDRIQVTTGPYLPSPPQPQGVISDNQYSFHYVANGPANNGGREILEYQIGYGTDPNTVQAIASVAPGANQILDGVISGLSRYTTYYVWSRARNLSGWSDWSFRAAVTTHAYVPAPPTPLGLLEYGQTMLHYAFQAADEGGSPVVEWQVGFSTDPNYVQGILGNQSGDVYLSGLQPGTTYYVWARGRNVEGWGSWSARLAARTIAGSRLLVWGVWKEAIPYVNVNGVWRLAQPYVKSVGLWKRGI